MSRQSVRQAEWKRSTCLYPTNIHTRFIKSYIEWNILFGWHGISATAAETKNEPYIHARTHTHTHIPIFFKAINDTNEVHTTIDGDDDDEDEGSRKEWPD